MSYQGWKNYETWCVKLWIDNDQGEYEYWREQTRAAWKDADGEKDDAVGALARMLKDYLEESMPEVQGMWADLMQAALSEVDHGEIAENMIDDEDFPANEDEDEDDDTDEVNP